MKRTELLAKVDELLTGYCTGCFLYTHHRRENSRSYAHRFCISKCTVGQKIQRYGDKFQN